MVRSQEAVTQIDTEEDYTQTLLEAAGSSVKPTETQIGIEEDYTRTLLGAAGSSVKPTETQIGIEEDYTRTLLEAAHGSSDKPTQSQIDIEEDYTPDRGVIRGYDALRYIATLSGLKHPERIQIVFYIVLEN